MNIQISGADGRRPGPATAAGRLPTSREDLAAFIYENADRIRAIARRKLPRESRGALDSEDVLSSVLRRLDNMAFQGELRPRSEAELWALITTITRNRAVDRRRLIERTKNHLTQDGPYAYELLKRLNECRDNDDATLLVLRMMMSIKNPTDRRLLALLQRGASHKAIGAALGISEAASRQRWMSLRRDLAERFAEGAFDDRR